MQTGTKSVYATRSVERILPGMCAVAAVATGWGAWPCRGQDPEAAPTTATVASLFTDFLHYSVLGKFDIADTFAQELLNHPQLNPVEVLRLSESHAKSVETLLILVNNSTIGERAVRVLEIIREGERTLRKDAGQVRTNIEKLGGHPQMEYLATMHLVESGEYAVPLMIQTLGDETQRSLWNRLIRALPQIGKAALNPLVESLAVRDDNLRETVIGVLGEIGYAQAVPYLLAVASDEATTSSVRESAMTSVGRIGERLGRRFGDSPAAAFVALGDQFYREHGSVAADARDPEANVWYWSNDIQGVERTAVPTRIFGAVMAMRCAERALQLDAGAADAIGLWLAANIRRESRLGLNVESGDPAESGETDLTRTADLPRALYFTSAAGPRYAEMVLNRAIADRDPPVALGALAALQRVGGPRAVSDSSADGAVSAALRFPDLVVRTRAALVIGNAAPVSPFHGAELVVPILASALTLTDRRNILVIDPDGERLRQTVEALRDADSNVVGESDVLTGLDRAVREFNSLSAILLSTRVTSPDARQSLLAIRERYLFTLTPVVLMAESEHAIWAEPLAESAPGVEFVVGAVDREALLARVASASGVVGMTPVDGDRAHELALLSAETLRRLALDRAGVFNVSDAERSAVAALDASQEDLQLAAIGLLATISSGGAQRAIAHIALAGSHTESLRTAAFAGLAESAKRFGSLLDGEQVDALLTFSFEEANLRLRTAASHALGALNVASDKASRIPLRFHRG